MSTPFLKNNLVVIGVDPGSRAAGYSVLRFSTQLSLLKSGTLFFSKDESLPLKLTSFYNFFSILIANLVKDSSQVFIAVESPFVFKNPHSSFIINSFYSVSMLLAGQNKLTFISMSPLEIKKAISGSGSSDKKLVSDFVKTYFPFITSFSSLDESDAIALSIVAFLKMDGLPL